MSGIHTALVEMEFQADSEMANLEERLGKAQDYLVATSSVLSADIISDNSGMVKALVRVESRDDETVDALKGRANEICKRAFCGFQLA